jgi:hypothetical protein
MDVCRCGRVIEQPATGRRRAWCLICSPRVMKDRKADVIQLPTPDPDSPGSLVYTSRKALEQAGVEDGWKAAAALAVAALIDSQKHGASGAAGNIKAHRESMQFALQDSGEEADVIEMIFREN